MEIRTQRVGYTVSPQERKAMTTVQCHFWDPRPRPTSFQACFPPRFNLGSPWQHRSVKGGTALSHGPLLTKCSMCPSLQSLELRASGSRTVGRAPRRSLCSPDEGTVSEGGVPVPRPTGQVLPSKDTGLGPLWLWVWPDTGRWQALKGSLIGRQN